MIGLLVWTCSSVLYNIIQQRSRIKKLQSETNNKENEEKRKKLFQFSALLERLKT
jgi:hypothetical protein